MVNQLPIMMYKGKKYFRDDRLRQIRAVNNPHDFLSFEDADEDDE